MAKKKGRQNPGDGGLYERADGMWCATVELGWVDGKRKRKTVYAKTKTRANRKLTELKQQLREAGTLPSADMTVEKWLTYWLDEIAAKRVKPSTMQSYRTSVTQYIVPSIGKVKLGKLAAHHVRALHHYVIDEKRKSTTTALNAHRILSAALNDAVRDDRVPRNVAARVRAPAKAVSTRTGLTAPDAIKALGQAWKDERLGSRWMAALMLGVRQGERLGLRWSHVYPDHIDLSWSLQKVAWAHGCDGCGKTPRSCPERFLPIPAGMEHEVLDRNLVLLRPKSRSSRRIVGLPYPVRVALEQRRKQVEAERANYTTDHDLVWCRPDGQPLNPREDWQAWRDLLKAAGVPLVTLHEARHTTATLLLDCGVDARVIQSILGHSTVAMSREYQHVSLALQQQAMDGLSEMLELT